MRAGRTWLFSGLERSCQYPFSRESDDLSCLDIPACMHIRPSSHFLPHVPSLLLEPLQLLSSHLESSSPEHRKSAPVGCLIVRVPAAAGVVGLRDLQAPVLNLGIGWLQARSRKRPSSQPGRRGGAWRLSPVSGSPQNHRLGLRSVNRYVTAGSQARSELDDAPSLSLISLGWSRAPAGGARTRGPFEDAGNAGKLEAKGPGEAEGWTTDRGMGE